MRLLLTVSALAVVLAAAPLAATAAAGPVVRSGAAPVVVLHGVGGERHAFWRGGDGDHGDHDFWRHHHRRDFIGPVGPIVGQTPALGPEPAPSPFVVAAPVFVNVTFAPGGEPAAMAPISGPRIIEIGRSAPQRGHLPLIVYGD